MLRDKVKSILKFRTSHLIMHDPIPIVLTAVVWQMVSQENRGSQKCVIKSEGSLCDESQGLIKVMCISFETS